MSEPAVSLRSLVIPLRDCALLVPSAVVAEVTGNVAPAPVPDVPDWVLGTIAWRRQVVPLVCMERAMGAAADAEAGSPRDRIVILYGLGGAPALPFYGIVARDIPRVYRASAQTVRSAATAAPGRPLTLDEITLSPGDSAVIPDLDALETRLRQYFPGP